MASRNCIRSVLGVPTWESTPAMHTGKLSPQCFRSKMCRKQSPRVMGAERSQMKKALHTIAICLVLTCVICIPFVFDTPKAQAAALQKDEFGRCYIEMPAKIDWNEWKKLIETDADLPPVKTVRIYQDCPVTQYRSPDPDINLADEVCHTDSSTGEKVCRVIWLR